MKPFLAALLLCPCLALSQTTTLPQPQQPLSQVKQYLGLTDAQVTAILQTNNEFNRFSVEQQRQIQNAQFQIAVETAKDQLDPMAIGTLCTGIESACRQLRESAMNTQKTNISILADAQKAKLNLLNDAIKLAPVISEAQFGNLLGTPGPTPFAFVGVSSAFASLSGVFPSGVSGCASPFPSNIIPVGRIFGAPPGTSDFVGRNTAPAQVSPEVNMWFDRTPGLDNGSKE